MSYMNPKMVRSPKQLVKNLEVIYDGGEDSWSLVNLEWDKKPSLGIRWNGNEDSIGTPQSRGIPTWFILPKELHNEIRNIAITLNKN